MGLQPGLNGQSAFKYLWLLMLGSGVLFLGASPHKLRVYLYFGSMPHRSQIRKIISLPRSGLTFAMRSIQETIGDFPYCEGYQCMDGSFKKIDCAARKIRPPTRCPSGRAVKDHDNWLLVRSTRPHNGLIVLKRRDESLAFSSFVRMKLQGLDPQNRSQLETLVALLFLPYWVAFLKKWSASPDESDLKLFYYEDLAGSLPTIARTILGRELTLTEASRLQGKDFTPRNRMVLPALESRLVVRQRRFWEKQPLPLLRLANLMGRAIWWFTRVVLANNTGGSKPTVPRIPKVWMGGRQYDR